MVVCIELCEVCWGKLYEVWNISVNVSSIVA